VTNVWNGGTSFFQSTDPSGNSTVPITDALGSVLALADSSGNLVTQYTYDPFGNTTASGAPSSNPFQYIRQENDGNGLYYLHARYYSPGLHRFISEDPLGFKAGDSNLHAYSFNSPTNFKDPSGKCVTGLIAVIGYDTYVIYKSLFGRKAMYYSGWDGLERIASGNAQAFMAGCMIEDLLVSAADLLGEGLAGESELADAELTCCFALGTPIHTKRGLVPIEKIQVGDEVLTRNMKTGRLQYKKVTRLTPPHLDKLLQLRIEGETDPLQPTADHPFFIKHVGTKTGDWVQASQIKVGDVVLTAKGTWSKVTALPITETEATVYNFEVEGNHNFFIGSSGLLVHNVSCKFGQQMHPGFKDFLTDLTNTTEEDWEFRLNPGETGPDATWKGAGPSPLGEGINTADLKPSSPYGITKMISQTEAWGTQGQTALFTYSSSGVYSPWFSIW